MIDESRILFVGLSTVVYTGRLESGFMFKKNDFIYVVMSSNISNSESSANGSVTCWYHIVRLATLEEKTIYEVMQS